MQEIIAVVLQIHLNRGNLKFADAGTGRRRQVSLFLLPSAQGLPPLRG